MHSRFLLLAIFALICACDLNDAPTTTDVTITPRLQVINSSTIPETDSVEVKLWSSTKVWYQQTLPWSAKSVTITGVPVGTEYTISLIGRSKQSDGSQFVWWNGSQTGTATASKTVDARTLTVPVTVYEPTVTPVASVSSPTFLPVGGTYTSTQSVCLSSSTSSATIYYTTDGSVPSTSSSVYNGPISVSSSMTIRAIAVKSGMNNSSVSGASYTISSTPTPTPTNGTIPWQTGITYGSVTHGGQTYKTVAIGTQTWMAENLNYAGPSSTVGKCYNNSADSCEKYGRLYTWAEVMQGSVSSSASPSGVQGICPDGWHVPSDVEWQTLEITVGMSASSAETAGPRGTTEGNKLKSTNGWISSSSGTDQYGFRALPSGFRGFNGAFYYVGGTGLWWSATEDNATYAWYRYMGNYDADVSRYANYKTNALSLRCLKDGP